jgi:NAD(P)-dependent dehydrogenase (short-subunit alcohol dehydrogenase family)
MPVHFQFSGVVVVTGAGGAIGSATAAAFHAAGASVVLAGREEAALATLARSLGSRCAVVVGDIAEAENRQHILAAAERLGGLQILVNNAALTKTKRSTLDTSLDDWDAIMDVNLRAVYALSLEAARLWHTKGRRGVIVNVSSPGAQRAHRNNAIYDTSKGGIDALTRCLAVDLGEYGIRVNAVAPAQIPHSHTTSIEHDAGRDLPLRRQGRPEDAAQAILFLASDAADFITGHLLPVDGGLLAQLRVGMP